MDSLACMWLVTSGSLCGTCRMIRLALCSRQDSLAWTRNGHTHSTCRHLGYRLDLHHWLLSLHGHLLDYNDLLWNGYSLLLKWSSYHLGRLDGLHILLWLNYYWLLDQCLLYGNRDCLDNSTCYSKEKFSPQELWFYFKGKCPMLKPNSNVKLRNFFNK